MITLTIPDMNCAHCKATVESVVATVPGARDVAVDLATRQVAISGTVATPALLAALSAAGYPATVAC